MVRVVVQAIGGGVLTPPELLFRLWGTHAALSLHDRAVSETARAGFRRE
jgi:hypothetical protein